ncbi:hypothetical protein HK104_002135 [Borealophlyctis nickersoniae]|nr:hypothetical protein HK104_002135 [Borealophlyctis nickersoniae]
METFEACEKERKTKAFSKEGVNAVQRVHPNAVQEDLDYYVENNQEPDFEEEMRFMRIKAPPEPAPTKDEGKRKPEDVKEDEASKSSKSPAAGGQGAKSPLVSARETAAAVTRGHALAAPNFTHRYSAVAASAEPSERTRAGSVGPGAPEEKRPTAKGK